MKKFIKYEDMTAFTIKESIKNRSREDKQARIDACWNLLINLHANGEVDFSTMKIAHALESRNIQRSQSYRNPQGKDYRDIVEAFANELGLRTTSMKVKNTTPLEDSLQKIQDLDVQARVRSMLDDLKRLQRENHILRQEMSCMQRVGEKNESELGAQPLPPLFVSPQEIISNIIPTPPTGSLRGFLQEDWMAAHDLTIDINGTVLCGDRAITLPGFVRQLGLLLGNFHKP